MNNIDWRSARIFCRRPHHCVDKELTRQVYKARFRFPVYYLGKSWGYSIFGSATSLDIGLQKWRLPTPLYNKHTRIIHRTPALEVEAGLIQQVYETRYPTLEYVFLASRDNLQVYVTGKVVLVT